MSAPSETQVVEQLTDPTGGEPSPTEVLRFDPFSASVDDEGQPEIGEESETPPAESTPAAPAAPAAPQATAPAAQAAPAAPAAAAPPAAVDPTEFANIVKLNKQLLGELAQLRASIQPQNPPASQAAPAKPEELQYAVKLPKELREMLRSDDPDVQAQALEALATGIAHIAHQNVREEYRRYYADREAEIVKKIQTDTAAREAAQRIFNDFYTTYPQLNKPELRTVVADAARAVTAEAGGNPAWTPELKKKVAERVFGLFGVALPAQAAEQQGGSQTTSPPGARKVTPPPKQRGIGVRPAAPSAPQPGSQEQHIADVISAFS